MTGEVTTDASLFTAAAGGAWLPTELARSPWSPDMLHGGPVAALAARAAEQLDTPGPMDPVRLTLELLKPVPVEPLVASAEVIRPGRNVQLIEVAVHAGETVLARGRVLRVRRDPGATTAAARATAMPAPAPPTAGAPSKFFRDDEWTAFHNAGVEHSFVKGGFRELGPSTDWIRVAVPVVPGEAPSPFQRVVAAADFANGISAAVEFEEATFLNPDLTVHLLRPLAGEWVGLSARTVVGPDGIALSHTTLYDQQGQLGVSAQSLLVQPR